MNPKFIRNKRALSPVIAGIILIAVTVAVTVAAATWLGSMTTSFMSIEELKITNCQWATDNSYVDLTINNFGTDSATINIIEVNGVAATNTTIISGSAKVDAGQNTVIRITKTFSPSTRYEFRLITQKGTGIIYISTSVNTSFTPSYASIHYVNTTSNVDGSSDKGSHSNFAYQQAGPDSVYDVLTEQDTGAGLIEILQYANISSSNVDGSSDFGTETNFVNVQDQSPDNDFMIVQEENLGGGSGGYPSVRSKTNSAETSDTNSHDVSLPPTIEAGDTILVVFVSDDNEVVAWENKGTDWNVIYEEDAGNSGPTMSIAWKKAVGNEDGTTITVTTGTSEESVHLSYAIQNAGDPTVLPPEASAEASGHSSSPNPRSLNPLGGSRNYLWFAFYGCDDDDMASGYPSTYPDNRETFESSSGSGTCAIGAASRDFSSSSDNPGVFTISSEQWEAATVAIYPSTLNYNHELDFEYQWTSADFDETREQVCIYVQTASQNGEHLVAYEWNGVSWQSLGTLNSNGWNNFTASYLSGATYTIDIRDEDKFNDSTQSSWSIDCIITDCSSTETNYELDIEIQFTDVDVDKDYTEICVSLGSATGEAMDVYVRNGGSWELLASSLVANQWNNVTRNITDGTVTLRLLGRNEATDVIQDYWEIDCALLYAPP